MQGLICYEVIKFTTPGKQCTRGIENITISSALAGIWERVLILSNTGKACVPTLKRERLKLKKYVLTEFMLCLPKKQGRALK